MVGSKKNKDTYELLFKFSINMFLEITTQITRASADVNGYLERLRKMSWDY